MKGPIRACCQEKLPSFGPILFPLAALFLLCLHGAAWAHEMRPTIVDLTVRADGALSMAMTANLEAMLAGIGPEHDDTDRSPASGAYEALRAGSSETLAARFWDFAPRLIDAIHVTADGRRVPLTVVGIDVPEVGDVGLARSSIIRLDGRLPEGATTLAWTFAPAFGDSVFRLRMADADAMHHSAYLAPGQASEVIPIDRITTQTAWSVFANYTVVGFDHILPKGLDHILFVIGLFLLSPRLKPLLAQITGFTLAHTLTLALGMLGIVQISPAIVEPLIALSIVYVAIENTLTDRLQRWRPAIVFGFGLLHGLGFAGVLAEFGLPGQHFITGLIAFNIGVELGQLSVIGLCFLAVGFWFGKASWYRQAVTVPASIVIALVAGFWFLERVGAIA